MVERLTICDCPAQRLWSAFPVASRYSPRKGRPWPAQSPYYRIAGAAGIVGVITPISCHFCNECNRIRVTSTGIAKSCLFASETCNLKPFLNAGDDFALQDALRRVINDKPERHAICEPEQQHTTLPMSLVGG